MGAGEDGRKESRKIVANSGRAAERVHPAYKWTFQSQEMLHIKRGSDLGGADTHAGKSTRARNIIWAHKFAIKGGDSLLEAFPDPCLG